MANNMEYVFFSVHSKTSRYTLRHTTPKVRCIVEHMVLTGAVCAFVLVLWSHSNFVYYGHTGSGGDHGFGVNGGRGGGVMLEAVKERGGGRGGGGGRNKKSHCLWGIPGFQHDADVTSVYIRVASHQEDDSSEEDVVQESTILPSSYSHVDASRWDGGGGGELIRRKGGGRGMKKDDDDVICTNLTQGNDDEYGRIQGSCDASSSAATNGTIGAKSFKGNANESGRPPLWFRWRPVDKEEANTDQQDDNKPGGRTNASKNENDVVNYHVYSYSQTKGYLLLDESVRRKHGISTQHVVVSPKDVQCLGEPTLQYLVTRFIGMETVALNWFLALHNGDGYLLNPRNDRLIDLHYASEFIPPIITSQSPTTSSTSSSSGTTSQGGGATVASSQVSSNRPYCDWFWFSKVTMMRAKRTVYRALQVLLFKSGILLTSLFLFFITTTLVSFTLRETQTKMLHFTLLLQSHVRQGLPYDRLILRHVVESCAFVPITVGMLFFLIEIYHGDRILAMMVLSVVWVCEIFTVMGMRTRESITFFPRVYFLYFALFHAYVFSCPYGFSYTALFATVLFLSHTMLFFWNRYELPALQYGTISDRVLRQAPIFEGVTRGGSGTEGSPPRRNSRNHEDEARATSTQQQQQGHRQQLETTNDRDGENSQALMASSHTEPLSPESRNDPLVSTPASLALLTSQLPSGNCPFRRVSSSPAPPPTRQSTGLYVGGGGGHPSTNSLAGRGSVASRLSRVTSDGSVMFLEGNDDGDDADDHYMTFMNGEVVVHRSERQVGMQQEVRISSFSSLSPEFNVYPPLREVHSMDAEDDSGGSSDHDVPDGCRQDASGPATEAVDAYLSSPEDSVTLDPTGAGDVQWRSSQQTGPFRTSIPVDAAQSSNSLADMLIVASNSQSPGQFFYR